MRRPRLGRFMLSTAAAGHATLTCACGRVGFEPVDEVVYPARMDAAVPLGDRMEDGALADSESPSSAAHLEGGTGDGSTTCPPGVLICEGFEGSLSGWTFARSDGAASITRESRSGLGALEISTRSIGATAYLERHFGPVSSGTVYVRAFVRVHGSGAIDGYDFLVLSNALAGSGLALSLNESTLSLSGIASGATSQGTLPYARDTWSCVELTLPVSQAMGIMVRLDDVEELGLLPDEGVPSGGYARIALGIVRASAQAPTTISVDDVVIATQPIGCN